MLVSIRSKPHYQIPELKSNTNLGLEVDVGAQTRLGAFHKAMVSELVLHFPEQDASRIHVWLGQDARS